MKFNDTLQCKFLYLKADGPGNYNIEELERQLGWVLLIIVLQ